MTLKIDLAGEQTAADEGFRALFRDPNRSYRMNARARYTSPDPEGTPARAEGRDDLVGAEPR